MAKVHMGFARVIVFKEALMYILFHLDTTGVHWRGRIRAMIGTERSTESGLHAPPCYSSYESGGPCLALCTARLNTTNENVLISACIQRLKHGCIISSLLCEGK